ILYLGKMFIYPFDSLLLSFYITVANLVVWIVVGFFIGVICRFVMVFFNFQWTMRKLMNFYIWFALTIFFSS
ncbi:MAG: hypothetical protein D6734_05955, partial [Candidatus Schekmanbacteria bacterium]